MNRRTISQPFQNPACANPSTSQQWKEMLALADQINHKLQKDDNINMLQYYLRYQDDHCFDILALVPKDIFFDDINAAKLKSLNQGIKQLGNKEDYRVALIVLPLIDNLNALNLDKEGYVLVYDALQAVA